MNVALLPIHPQYAESILNGEKHVEFRRKNFKNNVTHIAIYASSPIMKVVGYFEIEVIEVTTPKNAWRKYKKTGSISKIDFDSYYKNTETAVVIKIEKSFKFKNPLKITDLDQSYSAPQSYRYLSDEQFKRLKRLKTIN